MQAAYALMVRTFAGIPGNNLMQAIEQANESFGIEAPPEVVDANVEAQNDAALAQLEKRMMGTR